MNNVVDWKKIGDGWYEVRPSLGRKHGGLKVDVTDPNLERRYYLTDEEIAFLERIIYFTCHSDYLEMFFKGFRHRYRNFVRIFRSMPRHRMDILDSVRFCQSSFETYRHLAKEEEVEEERKLYENDDLLERTFYESKEEMFRLEGKESRIVPERGEVWEKVKAHVEWLGCYLPYQCNGNDFPEIHLFMDNITRVARRIGCKRLYVVAAVYLHEMCHALFDRFPLLLPKPYIPEVEEPLAECLSLKMLYLFVETSRIFYPNGSLLNMFDVAYAMVYRKRFHPAIAHYSLGRELFLCASEADTNYYQYSYFLKEQSADVQQYVQQFANGFPSQPHVAASMLEQLVNYMTR